MDNGAEGSLSARAIDNSATADFSPISGAVDRVVWNSFRTSFTKCPRQIARPRTLHENRPTRRDPAPAGLALRPAIVNEDVRYYTDDTAAALSLGGASRLGGPRQAAREEMYSPVVTIPRNGGRVRPKSSAFPARHYLYGGNVNSTTTKDARAGTRKTRRTVNAQDPPIVQLLGGWDESKRDADDTTADPHLLDQVFNDLLEDTTKDGGKNGDATIVPPPPSTDNGSQPKVVQHVDPSDRVSNWRGASFPKRPLSQNRKRQQVFTANPLDAVNQERVRHIHSSSAANPPTRVSPPANWVVPSTPVDDQEQPRSRRPPSPAFPRPVRDNMVYVTRPKSNTSRVYVGSVVPKSAGQITANDRHRKEYLLVQQPMQLRSKSIGHKHGQENRGELLENSTSFYSGANMRQPAQSDNCIICKQLQRLRS